MASRLHAISRTSGDLYEQSIQSLRRQAVLYGLTVFFSFATGTGEFP